MLNNNDIMKKLRVALRLRDTDILAILKLAEFEMSPSELSAVFRKEDHPHFMPCGDQLLRRFLDGLIIRNRGERDANLPAPSVKFSKRAHRMPGKGQVRPASPKDTVRVYRAES
jgi:uncharacterized protein YehS (DUF1456 family)